MRLAALEETGAMHARDTPYLDADGADGGGIAAIRAQPLLEDATASRFLDHPFHSLGNVHGLALVQRHVVGERLLDFQVYFADTILERMLVQTGSQEIFDLLLGDFVHLGLESGARLEEPDI